MLLKTKNNEWTGQLKNDFSKLLIKLRIIKLKQIKIFKRYVTTYLPHLQENIMNNFMSIVQKR